MQRWLPDLIELTSGTQWLHFPRSDNLVSRAVRLRSPIPSGKTNRGDPSQYSLITRNPRFTLLQTEDRDLIGTALGGNISNGERNVVAGKQ